MNHTRSRINWNEPEIDRRVRALLARMTLAEKIGQMVYKDGAKDRAEALIRAGSVGILANVHGADEVNRVQAIAVQESRLGIPLLTGNDVIQGYRTIFPIPLAQASSWNCELIERHATIAATEAIAAGTRWTCTPMVDVARDPRWGRIAEGAGEDTWLNCAVGRAQVRGFQAAEAATGRRFLSCVKHFAAYGACEAGRDYDTVDISENTLRNVYLPPFRACVDEGIETVMASFNEILGRPAAANHFLLTQILREEWGFAGLIVTDYNAVYELMTHGIAGSPGAAACAAIAAGVDVDMNADIFLGNLEKLVTSGRVAAAPIEGSAYRMLYLKFWLGLFDDPYTPAGREAEVLLCGAHREAARALARQSMVLLRNEGGLLPLPSTGRIAVVGPLADDGDAPLGWWRCRGRAEETVTVLEGIRQACGAANVLHAAGCALTEGGREGFADAVAAAQAADVVVLVLGESARMSGEAHSRADLGLPGRQEELLRAVHATGKPLVVVLINGRPLATPWLAENVSALLEAWQPGTEGGHAVADLLFGRCSPSGKLVVTIPRAAGQVPVYYNRKTTGRPAVDTGAWQYLDMPPRPFYPEPDTTRHLDLPATPQFPFGFGLSYTWFEYRDLQLSAAVIPSDGRVEVSATVRNAGERPGDEVAQLYVQDVVGSITRPVKELRGFRRISLRPGEEGRVEFSLGRAELGFFDARNEFVVEPGLFRVWIGGDSIGGLEGTFVVEGGAVSCGCGP